MPNHREVSVYVEVDGNKLEEYGHETIENTVTCYIEALEDKEYKFTGTYDKRAIKRLYLSGFIDGIEHLKGTINNGTIDQAYSILPEDDSDYDVKRALRFGRLGPSDDTNLDAVEETRTEVCDNIGSLQIKVWRCKRKTKLIPGSYENLPAFIPPKEIREKQLKGKGLTHKTTFGQPVHKSSTGNHLEIIHIDPVERPYVVFQFFYRSKGEYLTAFSEKHLSTDEMPAVLQSLRYIPSEDNSGGDEQSLIVLDSDTPSSDHGREGSPEEQVWKVLRRMKQENPQKFKRQIMELCDERPVRRKKARIQDAIVLSDTE